jgi:hypothetical protein
MFSPAPNSRTSNADWRGKVRRAVDLVVAFATLEDVPHGSVDEAPEHPHRRPLRSAPRARRPGQVPERHHACASPVTRRRRGISATASTR